MGARLPQMKDFPGKGQRCQAPSAVRTGQWFILNNVGLSRGSERGSGGRVTKLDRGQWRMQKGK